MVEIPEVVETRDDQISFNSEPPPSGAGALPLRGSLRQLIGRLINRITTITGVDFEVAPPTTLQGAKNHQDSVSNPHSTTATQVGALPIGGGTLTGALTLAGDPAAALQAATRQYVDAARSGLDVKQSVRVATVGSNVALTGLQTIDGVTLVAGDRILVKDQTTPSQNGIYVAAAGAWVRATDADSSTEVTPGLFVFVEAGTSNADTGWVLSTDASIVLNTTALSFTQFSQAGVIQAGTGLQKIGNALAAVFGSGAGQIAEGPHSHTAAGVGALALAGGTLTGVLALAGDPTADLHAATKRYVDAMATGLDLKPSVRAATTANIDLSVGGLLTIDGVVLAAGDRVLVKNQTTASQNGIYVAGAGAWSRATDADSSAEVTAGMFTFVEEGTTHGDQGWVLATNNPITLGTTALSFTQFSGVTGGGGGGMIQATESTLGGGEIADAGEAFAQTNHTTIMTPLRVGGLRVLSSKLFGDGLSNFPLGSSIFQVTTGNSGWPQTQGVVVTHHQSAGFAVQEFFARVGQEIHTRWWDSTLNAGAGGWGAFIKIGSTDYAPLAHVGAGGTAHALAVASGAAGFLSGSDKTKLDSLNTGGAPTAYYAKMSLSVATNVPVSEIVPFNTVDESNVGTFSNANDTFTPNRAGRYIVGAFVDLTPTTVTSGSRYLLNLHKNGSEYEALGRMVPGGATAAGVGGSVQLAADGVGDVFSLVLITNSGTTPQCSTNTYWWFMYIGV